MNKPSQFILLPTDKSTVESSLSNIILVDGELKITPSKGNDARGHHLYILSDDEIKELDWAYCTIDNDVSKISREYLKHISSVWKKIIATTNPELGHDLRPEISLKGKIVIPKIDAITKEKTILPISNTSSLCIMGKEKK